MSTQKRHQIQAPNEQELLSHSANTPSSWHSAYSSSAYIRITNLNMGLTEGDILTVFSQYGEITDIKLLRDSQTGISRGSAYLCYLDQRSSVLAVDNLNGVELAGKVITVDHALDYFRMLDKEELAPYLTQQLFGMKRVDRGQNFHLRADYQRMTEAEYETMLDLVDRHTLRTKASAADAAAGNVVGNVIFADSEQQDSAANSTAVKQEHSDPLQQTTLFPAKVKKEKVKKEKKRKRNSEMDSSSGKKKKKLSKEEREALLREYQERCKQVRGVEAKEVDGHLYGLATGFDVRHGENRVTMESREAYEKVHGYGSGEIKSTGRSDVDALEKFAYDMRKQRRDEDLAKREEEEKERLREKTRRHEERMEREFKRRTQQQGGASANRNDDAWRR